MQLFRSLEGVPTRGEAKEKLRRSQAKAKERPGRGQAKARQGVARATLAFLPKSGKEEKLSRDFGSNKTKNKRVLHFAKGKECVCVCPSD